MLTIRLFGPPQIDAYGQPVAVTRRKSRALLYYLAAAFEPVQRERLLALLWPDDDHAAARHSLRTTVHGLRQILGPVLETTSDALVLAPAVEVDARRLTAGLVDGRTDAGALQAALSWYRGAFLEAFTLPDNPAYEAWITGTREHYHSQVVDGLHTLAQHQAQHDIAAALATVGRALTLDPLREDLQRTAMQFQYRLGDRAGAIRRFEHLRRQLDDELGLPPLPETQALYDALITDTLDPPPPPPEAVVRQTVRHPRPPLLTAVTPQLLPFVGREDELALLWQQTDTPQLVLIEGEAGIGKSRLAHEFIQTLDALPLVGAAHALERGLPYQPIRAALRTLLTHPDWPMLRDRLQLAVVWHIEIARLLPELAVTSAVPASVVGDEARLWEGIQQFLRALARQRPLVLLIDDLHWADESTLGLLGALVRETFDAPITFIATTQPVTPHSSLTTLLHDLTRAGRLMRIALTRLTHADVAHLAQVLSPANAGILAQWLHDMTDGSPFVLTELVRDARASGRLRSDGSIDPVAFAGTHALPQTVTALVQARLAQLRPATRRLLDTAVVAGHVFAHDVVARAAGLDDEAALDALDELRAAGLIVPHDATRYAFDHSLTVHVAMQELDPARVMVYHRRLAEALEQNTVSTPESGAEQLALHWAAAGQPQRAAPYAFYAGQRAARLAAWREAAMWFQQALEAGIEPRHLTLLSLGRARYAAGDAVPAATSFAEAIGQAAAMGNHDAVTEARLELAITYLPQARDQEVIALAQAALQSPWFAHQIQAELLWGTALAHTGQDLDGAMSHLHAAELLLAREAKPDPTSLAHVLFELGGVAAQQGDLHHACARYRAVVALTQDAAFPTADQWAALALNNLAYHLHLLGDSTARATAEAGMRLAEDRGLRGLQTYLHSTLGEIALAANDLLAAETHFQAGLALAEVRRQAERVAGLTANRGRVAAAHGAREAAVELLTSACADADALEARHLAAQIRIWLAPLLPLDAARVCLAEARRLAQPSRRRLLDAIDRLETQLCDAPA